MKKTNKLYTLEQLALETGIPDSTVRHYKKNYKEFFSQEKVEGKKHPLFTNETIEVLKTIREIATKGGSRVEILEALNERFQPVYDAETEATATEQYNNPQYNHQKITTTNPQESSALQTPQIPHMQAMRQLTDFAEMQVQLTAHYKDQNTQQAEVIDKLKQIAGDLKEENEELKRKLDELEKSDNPSLLRKIFG